MASLVGGGLDESVLLFRFRGLKNGANFFANFHPENLTWCETCKNQQVRGRHLRELTFDQNHSIFMIFKFFGGRPTLGVKVGEKLGEVKKSQNHHFWKIFYTHSSMLGGFLKNTPILAEILGSRF